MSSVHDSVLEEDHEQGEVMQGDESKVISNEIAHRPYFEDLSNHIKIGILGTTNVGKSSLFNILSRSPRIHSHVANALFTTIDPFVATFIPHDERIEFMKKCFPAAVIKPAKITVVDTAGLIANSVRDQQGVGAASLEAVQHVDALLILLRCFDSDTIASYEPRFDPLRDLRMIELELLQKDLIKIEGLLVEIESFVNEAQGAEHLQFQYGLLLKLWGFVAGEARPPPPKKASSRKAPTHGLHRTRMPKQCSGSLVRLGHWDIRERDAIASYKLLTAKEMVYVANITALDFNRRRKLPCTDQLQALLTDRHDPSALVMVSIELEQRLVDEDEAGTLADYFAINGTHRSGIPALLEAVHNGLKAIHYYTAAEDEVKCQLLRRGATVIEAAAKKNALIARSFIRADVITFEDFLLYGGDRLQLSMDGRVHAEGRRYVVNDGDMLEFLHHPIEPF